MALHTLSQTALAQIAFAPAALANSTQNGPSIDTGAPSSGGPYRRACFIIQLNPGAATTANFQIQESADGSTNWTNVANATLGTALAASNSAVYMVDVDLAKRLEFLRVQIIGTGTAGAASAELVLFEGEYLAPTQSQTPIVV